MSYAERSIWVRLITTVLVFGAYVPIVLPPAIRSVPSGLDWLWAMIWAIGTGVGLSIVGTIVVSMGAGIRRGPDTMMDERDTTIAHTSGRVGQAFIVIAALASIVMLALEIPNFWIAHTLFFGFSVSALIEGISAVIMYRRGTA